MQNNSHDIVAYCKKFDALQHVGILSQLIRNIGNLMSTHVLQVYICIFFLFYKSNLLNIVEQCILWNLEVMNPKYIDINYQWKKKKTKLWMWVLPHTDVISNICTTTYHMLAMKHYCGIVNKQIKIHCIEVHCSK
jgi:hypothetical protein